MGDARVPFGHLSDDPEDLANVSAGFFEPLGNDPALQAETEAEAQNYLAGQTYRFMGGDAIINRIPFGVGAIWDYLKNNRPGVYRECVEGCRAILIKHASAASMILVIENMTEPRPENVTDFDFVLHAETDLGVIIDWLPVGPVTSQAGEDKEQLRRRFLSDESEDMPHVPAAASLAPGARTNAAMAAIQKALDSETAYVKQRMAHAGPDAEARANRRQVEFFVQLLEGYYTSDVSVPLARNWDQGEQTRHGLRKMLHIAFRCAMLHGFPRRGDDLTKYVPHAMTPNTVWEAILSERKYQDSLPPTRFSQVDQKEKPHDLFSHVVMLSRYVKAMVEDWTMNGSLPGWAHHECGDVKALDQMRKIAGIIVRYAETDPLPLRPGDWKAPTAEAEPRLKTFLIRAGTVIKLNGMPFKCKDDTYVLGHEANWKIANEPIEHTGEGLTEGGS